MAEENKNGAVQSPDIQKIVDAAVSKALEEYTKPKPEPTIGEKAKKEAEDEENNLKNKSAIENAAVFNAQINDFVKKNEAFLPKIASKIAKTVSEQKFDDSVKKANALRKELITCFFELKENVEILPENFRDKVKVFNDLSEDAKANRSEEFFELVTLGINQKEMIARQKNIEKANKGLVSGDSDEYLQRLYNKAYERYGIKKTA